MLAFFYLGENVRLRNIALAGFVVDIVAFYAVYASQGAFPSRVPLPTLSTAGLVSVLCAGLYVTMMAFYYGRIVASNSELEREVQRHKQTAIMLVEARDASEAANRAKSEFLATMGHELRTPLNAVIGFSQVMGRESFGPLGHANYKEYAKDIQDSGSHLLEIINDILDISKAEFGAIELDERLLDCHALIVSSCRLVRSRLEKSQLTLDLRLPMAIPQLRADPRLFKRMLLNLLTNAIKFTPPNGRIAVEVAADPRQGLAIAVRDTGIGIAEADLSRVRKAFVQADSALSRRHEGVGLGLPLAEMMMRQHGGTLQLESVKGKGTTARLLFPGERLVWSGACEAAPQADGAIGLDSEPGAARSAKTSEPPHILVVEDDKDLCDLLRRMLERAGFAAAGAYNGREALRHLKTEPADLVITDMVMPEMDGVELMRILRKNRPTLPIIALSGVENFREYCRIATHLGAQATLYKPVRRGHLIRTVNDVLAGRLSNETRPISG
jgi:signal transduction histidine kinase/ActR/RegA family two-component response regulator